MLKQFVTLLIAFLFALAFAQTELEFAPPEGVQAPPGLLREARNVLQQRLERFLGPNKKFTVTLQGRTMIVSLESSVETEALVQLCTTIGKLEFIDSEVGLEEGETFSGSGRVVFTDHDIRKATSSVSEFGTPVVELELSPQGGDKLAAYSRESVGRFLVIVKDGQVLSSPLIQSEIPDGKVWIQSNFSLEEAERLAAELSGRLPVPLELVRQN
jgi:preprotein translocase subunit SecD